VNVQVVVADGSPLIRLAIRSALLRDGVRPVVEVASAEDALAAATRAPGAVVLLDRHLDPDLLLARELCAVLRGGALVVLADAVSEHGALSAVRAGACGLLPKTISPVRLPAIVRGVLAGEAAFPRCVERSLLESLHEAPRRFGDPAHSWPWLTAREHEVLDLLAHGDHDVCIAERLGVSPITVRRHVAEASRKLRAHGRSEAVALYQQAIA
jgi:DNA-binding NarL/FixJ family response regulator